MNDSSEQTASAIFGSLGSSIQSKWASSSGPTHVSKITSSLPDSVKSRASTLTSTYFNMRYFRSPKVYLGMGEDKPFYVETNVGLNVDRVKHNLTYFYLNYIFLTFLLFALTLMISPSSLISIAILAFAWFYVLKVTADDGYSIGGVVVTQKVATAVMGVITVLCLTYVLSSIFWWTLCTSGFCIAGHSLFRDASMHKDEADHVEMSGDLEEAPFLNAMEDESNVV
ncbi:hypothetical protein TrVE_jg9485 [Triparma verrucosa]|uniref:PRA1 family protein n=2 Tax=Triparma TaxID=722752 RepID=A0A9W7E495_9STRA|nr:hypothetical protein TrST_g8431 [Triparma strigata]GMI03976.1 hypothetical protein TrVE_jg9485 [Triparma verrucosa]